MTKAPAIFVGHGSPMNAIEDTPFARGWRDIAQRFPRPRAVVCVSAHWVTDGQRVMSNARPKTIHDFGKSFPPQLFAVKYPAPGHPALARDVASMLAPFGARTDDSWGYDHGAWSVLKWMYPDADVPLLQVSLDARQTPHQRYAVGRALAPLRDDNVAIIGSGNVVHNLRAFFSADDAQRAVCERFDSFIVERIEANDNRAVEDYASHPDAPIAAPDWDHFTPLLYVLGARSAEEKPLVFNRDVGVGISMTSLAFGLPA